MNKAQQRNLDKIWDELKRGVYKSVGPVSPSIDVDTNSEQVMTLPLSSGGNIFVKRCPPGEWVIAK